MWEILFFICSGCSLLSSNEFWVIYKAILVLVIAVKNRINHVLQFIVTKNLCLWGRSTRLGIMVGLVVPMDERFHQLQPIQLVVTVTVMHFEVMELQLLLTHVTCVNVLLVLLHVLLLMVDACLVLVQHPLTTCLSCLLRWTLALLNWSTCALRGALTRRGRLALELLGWLTLELLRWLSLKLLGRLTLELLRRGLSLKLLWWWGLTLELLWWLSLELLLLLLILLWVDSRQISLLSSGCVAQREQEQKHSHPSLLPCSLLAALSCRSESSNKSL